ncbi:multicopper oxidase family protein [Paeniroseomonas aquatica]|uniref:multicopper oxidase family protein n=1 Tax=Paeniroseomonas aquatica TaxID=373043 RepID=UPI0036134C87
MLDARQQGQVIALSAQAGRTSFYPGRPSDTLGYNGSYLGPTLRVHRGDEVKVAVTNRLSADTTVHWHGLLIPGELDGGPHQLIPPGTTWRPNLPVRQPAATLLYHSHVHGLTAEQVYSGLAGMLIVTDQEEQGLGLPSDYGVDDLPLLIQDRQFQDGRLVMPAGMMTAMQGRRGDTILVNGAPNPWPRCRTAWSGCAWSTAPTPASTTFPSATGAASTGSAPRAACWNGRWHCGASPWRPGNGPRSSWISPTAGRSLW